VKNFHGTQGDGGDGTPIPAFWIFAFRWIRSRCSSIIVTLIYVNRNRSLKNSILPFGPGFSVSIGVPNPCAVCSSHAGGTSKINNLDVMKHDL